MLTRTQLETAVSSAVSEIQRRNRERGFIVRDSVGHPYPAVSDGEMERIVMQFLDSAEEGLG